MKFFRLFSSLSIQGMKLSNRIVMPAMHLNLADKGFMTQDLIDFYSERAKGGAGLILVGGCYVSLYGKGVPMMIAVDDDKYIPKMKEFTEAIHQAREGVKVGAQLYHSGRYSFPQIIGTTPLSSSAEYSNFSKSTPKRMTLEEIEQEQKAFADAALRAQKAGFDCVEICGSAGYLIDQFLSPLVNKREDEYGGSLENRLRFPLGIINKIRDQVDDEFVVGMRMAGDDFVPGSLTYKDKPPIAKAYESAGIDYINVTGGWHETKVPQLTMDVPEGCFTYLAKNIKESVSIPVFASNRINYPKIAEETLLADQADAICMGRGLIADPYLPKKAKAGNLRDIIYCVGCNQGCFDNVFAMRSITCLRNPRAGREAKTELNPVKEQKKVMIVGAGPAGLEAARIAKKRGHNVHLFEEDDRIGGLLNIIWKPPGRHEFKRMIENYQYWLQKLNINVHLNEKVDLGKIRGFAPDIVLLATGTVPNKPPIEGIDQGHVYWANDVLSNDAPVGKNNVIIGGGATGIEVALYLAKFGSLEPKQFEFLTFYDALEVNKALDMLYTGDRNVTILEQLPRCGANLGKTTRWVLFEKCEKLGVDIKNNARVTEIGKDYVKYSTETEEEKVLKDIDRVYYATGVKSEDSLYDDVKDLGIKIKKIGDARKPETVLEATYRAYRIANRI
ncbi:MAG: FAD-dependent oxidoreductase [Promethearchaeia archaeon]